jgi:hypothetical protein
MRGPVQRRPTGERNRLPCAENNELGAAPQDAPALYAASLENVAERPIEVGDFRLREINAMTLRRHEETKLALEEVEPFRRRVFPPGILRPGEKIVLPVRIELAQSTVEEDFQQALETAAAQGSRVLNVIRTRGDTLIDIRDHDQTVLFRKPASSFPSQVVPDIIERFEYGPAWRIETVEVNGTEFLFASMTLTNSFLVAGIGVGSCPYVFSYQHDTQLWHSEGHFLYGAVTQEKKRKEEKALRLFEGRLAIRELEHEIAFLDIINLKLEDQDGKVSIHKPARVSLRDNDGHELLLAYGQGIELDFGLAEADWRGKKASLIVAGYYVPLSNPGLVNARPRD